MNPKPFLASLVGSPVVVRLKWGMEYRGRLTSTDAYFNVLLGDAEEWVGGAMAGRIGEVLIRYVSCFLLRCRGVLLPASWVSVCLGLLRGTMLLCGFSRGEDVACEIVPAARDVGAEGAICSHVFFLLRDASLTLFPFVLLFFSLPYRVTCSFLPLRWAFPIHAG